MNYLALIAQAGVETLQPFAREGIVGAVVVWLCLRVEKRLDRMDHTMKGLAMGILMDLSTRKVLGTVAQKMVDEALKKMGVEPEGIL